MQTLLLDLFSNIALVSSMMTIVSTNPIHSVIFLILVFCNVTGLLVVLTSKIEFLAIMSLIIYVGAIAVLFTFVVMMLNVRDERPFRHFIAFVGGGLISVTLLLEICWWKPENAFFSPTDPSSTNIQSLGNLIYTYYFYYSLMASFILLVAMIGAIVLTMHKRKNASTMLNTFKFTALQFEDSLSFAS